MAEREIETTTTTTVTTRIIDKSEPPPKQSAISGDPIMNFLKGSVACVGVAILLIIAMQPRVNISNSGGNNTIHLNN